MPKKIITHKMIEAFRAAVTQGGISAGADALGMSQPSMSRLMTELQHLVGFPLFMKHGRTVKPTDEALALMTKVHESFLGLEEITRFSEQLRKQRLGRLSISTIPSIGHSIMPEAVEHLRSKYPDVVISLTISSYLEVASSVRNRDADIGFTADKLSIGDLETVAEFSADCVCIGTSRWLPSKAAFVAPKDLLGKPFVGMTGAFQRHIDALMSTTGQQLDVMVETSLFQTASELVLRGMGLAIVDALTGARHRLRGGIALPLRPTIRYTVYATAMADTRLSKPARELLQYLGAATGKAKTHTSHE
ncbi:MAG TPA: LysR substrate-binding domain-containing protein [Ramlibacter sp.]|uniref:LysR family transcriptional regulator n=1 Tax=Ramlibacter sp. TaxID=1917967 RepID=UPI002D7E8E57|nr:LysR substrate-binding domain-containing protein [Ramlibacter sp.]HET8746602.1 LysR substrate-binding domain-containing protein [Ramlibacter sp.]